jgi:adenine-specific DNA-methyltransferase
MDANLLAPTLCDVDLAYIDPPYSQHSFHTAYHPLVTLVLNDAPATYGSEGKRLDCKLVKSPYNSKLLARAAWADLIANIRAPYVLASTSDEALVNPQHVIALMGMRGHVASLAIRHDRYIGWRVGIYNPAGEKVGTPGKGENREHLILCGPDQHVVSDAIARARQQIVPATPSQLSLCDEM